MKVIYLIITISVFVGLAAAAWLMAIIMIASKKVPNKAVLKRWLRMQGLLFIAFMFSCSPGQLVGTGYLVSVKQNGEITNHRVDTRAEADSIYNALVYPDPLGKHDPFYEFRNSELFIYIEKKGIYEKNGKTKWKMYDKKLEK